MDATESGGVAIQRFWSTSTITAGNVYKCGKWYTGEGTVQLLIAVRSHTAGNSGTTTYMYQGSFAAISSTGIRRLMPLTVGTGHGNGPDNGTNSNAWEVLIKNDNNYTYEVYIHVPSGVANKNLRVTVTEIGRALTFTDLSSTVAYSSLTVQSGVILSSNYNHLGHTHLRDNYKINLGNDDDFQLFHNGTNSFISNTTGIIQIDSDSRVQDNATEFRVKNAADTETIAKFIQDGAVELYHNNAKKLETTSVGANITDGELRIGDASGGNDALIRLGATGTGVDTHGVMFYDKSDNSMSFVVSGESHGVGGLMIRNGGNVKTASIFPFADSTHDLGANGTRWANVYADTLYGDGSNITAVNATTLDSIDSANFLRTDVTQTASNRITFSSGSLQLSSHYFHGYYSGTTNYIHLYPYNTTSGNASVTNIRAFNGSSADTFQITGGSATGLSWRGYTIWTAENDGSGSTLDADTVDGLQASQFLRNDADSTIQAVLTTRRISVQANHDIRLAIGNWTGDITTPKIQAHSDALYIVGGTNGIRFRENATDRAYIDGSGNFHPAQDSAYSLGLSSRRWTHTYTDALTVTNSVSVGGDVTVSGGSGALTVSANSDIRFSSGNWTGEASYKIQVHSSSMYLQAPAIIFRSNNGSNRWAIDSSGHLRPAADNTYDLGASNLRPRNVYGVTFYGSAAGLTASTLPTAEAGISAVGNFGQWQGHGTYTDFNTEPAYWGWNYVQGNTNAPNTASGQWYRCRLSLGSSYGKGSDSNDYSMDLTIPRTQDGGQGQMWVRPLENGVEGTWMEVGSRPYNSVIPRANNAIDLGSSSIRWRNIYTNDLNLSNENKEGGNDVDGTTGNWTIQEGHDELYVINNVTGKRYAMMLREV